MSKQPYSTYVLRMWRDGSEWRASIKEARNNKQHNFVSLESLVEFLYTQAEQTPRNGDKQ